MKKRGLSVIDKIEDRLNKLSKYKDNWDSYGARAITKEALDSCRSLIDNISVIAVNDGGIDLEVGNIEIDSIHLCLHIDPDGTTQLYYLENCK
jgi:hypothetical protein